MNDASSGHRLGGGIFLAVGPILGTLIGAAYGQPSIGLLAGLTTGAAIAMLVWLRNR